MINVGLDSQEGPYAGCKVTQGFNDTTNPTKRGHLGYDLGGDFENISPIMEGKVVALQKDPYVYDNNGKKIKKYDKNGVFIGYEQHANGVTVTIEHINAQGQVFYSTYSHLKEGSIDHLIRGSEVTTKSLIGTKGNTGASTGPHLHLSVYTRKEPTRNPFGYTADGQVFADFFNKTYGINYSANNYYYDIIRKGYYQGRYFDPYLVMITNGEIISLFNN